MRRLIGLILTGLAFCASPCAAEPLLFVYKGAGCTGRAALPRFETFLGRKADGVTDFADWTSTWPNLVHSATWIAGCWHGRGYRLSLSVPMLTAQSRGSGALDNVASGRFDPYFRQIAAILVREGFADAFVRVGEEFNQTYYPWSAVGRPRRWVAAYRHIVAVMRSTPGARFTFVWNPAQYRGPMPADLAYPGDDSVDVIGQDTYNQSWAPLVIADNHAREPWLWCVVAHAPWGVSGLLAFAKAHHKPVAYPEWGTGTRPDGHGGGDDPQFIRQMAGIISDPANHVVFAGYWDYPAGDFNGLLSDHHQPRAADAFRRAFGRR